ncbi:C40 family peptidase, partial [Bacteroidota bacterium]
NQNWINILTVFDKYEGWIDKKMHFELDEEIQHHFLNKKPFVNAQNINIYENRELLFPLTVLPGSNLFFGKSNYSFEIQDKLYYIKEEEKIELTAYGSNDIIFIAKRFLNAPYLWGGRTPYGIDCSGFTQTVNKICNIKLPRDASQQVELGETIDFIDEVKQGDLAFFDNQDGNIVHVGIILEDSRIIHASGKVRIDQLDHQGIFNREINEYSHKLRIIKRIL